MSRVTVWLFVITATGFLNSTSTSRHARVSFSRRSIG